MLGSPVKDIVSPDLHMVCKICNQETNTHFALKLNVFYAANQHEIVNAGPHNVIFAVAELPRITLHFNTFNYTVRHRGLGGLHM